LAGYLGASLWNILETNGFQTFLNRNPAAELTENSLIKKHSNILENVGMFFNIKFFRACLESNARLIFIYKNRSPLVGQIKQNVFYNPLTKSS